MESKKVVRFGTWTSPITTDIVSGSSLIFAEVYANPTSGKIYLIEGRPAEKGRQVIVEVRGPETIDLLPAQYSARSKVHEYGGAAATLSPDGDLIFVDHSTNGVFSLSPKGEVTEILAGNPNLRYANFDMHPQDTHLIIAIQEDHSAPLLVDAVNTLVVIHSRTKKAEIVVKGADFYSQAKFSPDGKKLSWLQWSHPDMPWTGSEVHVANWENGKVGKTTKVAGKAREESISMPKWHIDNTLLFASDRTGFWQLYRYDPVSENTTYLHLKGYEDAEMGCREFGLGSCTYLSMDANTLVITYNKDATNGLLLYDIAKDYVTELPTGLVTIDQCALSKVSPTVFAVIGATLTSPEALYLIDITRPSEKKLLKTSISVSLPPSIFSPAQTITFPRTHGDIGTPSHAIFIPPQNPSFDGPAGSKPPLIIFSHGGPTSHVSPGLAIHAQYFTSRGFAYCYPNYAGSTGYGRDYRAQLDHNWGIKDVEDTISCVEYLASQNLIDISKVGISGRSSGGYTTIQALTSFPKFFAAGVSLFGIGNLKALFEDDPHKFESQYGIALVFPEGATGEEREPIMVERSPCLHAEKIESPLLLLQGDIDRVVPIEQSREMERVIKQRGGDVRMVVFEGEGHGFKMREHLKAAIEEEEGMWKRTLL
ncbi:related to dipeptidyl aminopeptidases/acylaminoacyl-peptidases [Rhynchosporium graminicola]|uniref:Related to dipeptidyl aminopeptidases/acylaminoacyl-peptidases n=1 Tax=Rhynchosporium graminicola TaxID=2792576 RepID=A0A1E1JZG9_9HELO|nr:related to dipeptidyl aminopeptidases/acylaminoacyl-peptidases [Rhynchosporium commune]